MYPQSWQRSAIHTERKNLSVTNPKCYFRLEETAMSEESSSEKDEVPTNEIKVLNSGFVRLVDHMGDDDRVVQSARVSYGAGTKSVREDRGLIHYLMKNSHTSPFEQVVFTFHIKAPIFVARQWVRHRTARMNEISGRYSVMSDEFYVPEVDDIRFQSKSNKQGRSEEEVPSEFAADFRKTVQEDQRLLYRRYDSYIQSDVARELARVNLPLSLYTQFYWQMDLHNLFHFLKLRLDQHAQKEIRIYGEAIASFVRAIAPLSYEAFEEYVLQSIVLSKQEVSDIKEILKRSISNGADLPQWIKQKFSIT
jgi:thymidylate synthase (FAD)